MTYFWIIFSLIALVVVASGNLNYQIFPGDFEKEDPIDILKRRFAIGEIDEQEYEERKAVLEDQRFV
jgi:putative membrane protein